MTAGSHGRVLSAVSADEHPMLGVVIEAQLMNPHDGIGVVGGPFGAEAAGGEQQAQEQSAHG